MVYSPKFCFSIKYPFFHSLMTHFKRDKINNVSVFFIYFQQSKLDLIYNLIVYKKLNFFSCYICTNMCKFFQRNSIEDLHFTRQNINKIGTSTQSTNSSVKAR